MLCRKSAYIHIEEYLVAPWLKLQRSTKAVYFLNSCEINGHESKDLVFYLFIFDSKDFKS